MLQEMFRANIETKLNDNTYNKKFILGSYAYQKDTDTDYIYSIKNGYTVISTDYIPCMMSFTADFQAIPDEINGNATIGLEFLVKSDLNADLINDIDSINEILSKIIGNYESVVDGTTTYKTVWSMDALAPGGLTEPINGTYYTRIVTSVYIDFSDTNVFGNAYRYYIDGVLLTPYDGLVNRENEENYPHKQGDYESKGGLTTSQWSLTLVSYVNTGVKTICDSISSGTYDMEKVYTYLEKYDGATLHTFPVKITSISRPIVLGEKQFISISLIKSDEAKPVTP